MASTKTGVKAKRESTIESAPVAEEPSTDDLLAAALSVEPFQREGDAVQKALEWWLQCLPTRGECLSPELPGGSSLLEIFMRGKLANFSKGQRIQNEGEDVLMYALVLSGRCRLRCKIPAKGTQRVAEDASLFEAAGVDADGLVTCGTIRTGELFRQAPGEYGATRSIYDIVVEMETQLLVLSVDDYNTTLRSHHAGLQAKAVEFLQQHRICPQAPIDKLQRIAAYLQHRIVKRGVKIRRAGDFHRGIFMLRQGACNVVAEGLSVEDSDDTERIAAEASDEERERVNAMRQASRGAEEQQKVAAERARNEIVAPYAYGAMRRHFVNRSPPSNSHPSSALHRQGAIFGEEVLLYENLRDAVFARGCYTVTTVEECHFYVADVTCFRQLAMQAGTEHIQTIVSEKLDRHCSLLSRNDAVARNLSTQYRRLLKRDLQRGDRPQIRPPFSTGCRGPSEVEDLDSWLQVTYDHRTAPVDEMNPSSLWCLEALGKLGKEVGHGAGVKGYEARQKEEATGNFRRFIWQSRGNSSASDSNPLGSSVAGGVNFTRAAPSSQGEGLPQSTLLDVPERINSGTQAHSQGSFFPTEPDLEEGSPQRIPSRPSSSVPILPRLEDSRTEEVSRISQAFSQRPNTTSSATMRSLGKTQLSGSRKTAGLDPSGRVRKAFDVKKTLDSVIKGKSVLVFTANKDVRKSVIGSLLGGDRVCCFLKTSIELWQRLHDKREQHHVLILDLDKFELPVESLLSTIRQHPRYGKIPIIVLSEDRELSEQVRTSCSFVVFKPIIASMMHEALLWCLDKRSLQGVFRHEEIAAAAAAADLKVVA